MHREYQWWSSNIDTSLGSVITQSICQNPFSGLLEPSDNPVLCLSALENNKLRTRWVKWRNRLQCCLRLSFLVNDLPQPSHTRGMWPK